MAASVERYRISGRPATAKLGSFPASANQDKIAAVEKFRQPTMMNHKQPSMLK